MNELIRKAMMTTPEKLMRRSLCLLLILVTLSSCAHHDAISNFEECVRAGNPVMESYPRQCKDASSGQVFTEEAEASPLVTIRTGTAFGECTGYCRQEVVMTPGGITLHRSGSGLPDIHERAPMPAERWNSLLRAFAVERFISLPDVIGCPDCADGGAEWVEIQTGTRRKRITFEYEAALPDIEDFLHAVRSVRDNKDLFCSSHSHVTCPDRCALCSPCRACSSLACRTAEFCRHLQESLGP